MKKVSLAVLISLCALTSAAYAQTEGGVTMSTDQQKAADVLQRAQDLQSRQSAAQSAQMPMQMPMHQHHNMHRRHGKAGMCCHKGHHAPQ